MSGHGAQLMLALDRSGRGAEALQCYDDARRTLVEELGVEPGDRLRDLHAAILREDPELGRAPRGTRRRRPAGARAAGCSRASPQCWSPPRRP